MAGVYSIGGRHGTIVSARVGGRTYACVPADVPIDPEFAAPRPPPGLAISFSLLLRPLSRRKQKKQRVRLALYRRHMRRAPPTELSRFTEALLLAGFEPKKLQREVT